MSSIYADSAEGKRAFSIDKRTSSLTAEREAVMEGYCYLGEEEETGSDNRAFLYLYGTALLRV